MATDLRQGAEEPPTWAALPIEISERVFLCLEPGTQARARLVCRDWAAEACHRLCPNKDIAQGPAGWGRRLQGVQTARWHCSSEVPLAKEMEELRQLSRLHSIVISDITDNDMPALASLPSSLTSLELEM